MLEGEQLLNPGKGPKGEDGKGARWPMPKEADFAGEFADKVGDAFAGDPRGYEVAYQAVRAYYAGAAARQGLIDASKADPKLLGEAIEAATGGVSRVNGKPVLRPWGMHEGEFKAGLQSQFQQAVAANGWAGTPFADFDAFRLRALGGGRYLLGNGADAAVYGRDGRPVVLTLDAGERAAPIPGIGRPAPVTTEPSAASRIPPVWR